jgi:PAS domain S-box-containing protein
MSSMLKLLILEDRPEDVELVLYELRRAGFHPRWWHAENEEQYTQYLAANEMDLILADYRLPQFNALRALQMMKERNIDVPFIVVTGTVNEETVVECMHQGAADYLLKDRLARLGQAVTRALDERQLRVEKQLAETALHESDERFERLAENAQDVIYRMQILPKFIIDYISPASLKVLGYSPQEFYRDHSLWLKILHEDDYLHFQERIAKHLNPPRRPIRIIRRDGQIRWMDIRDTPVLDEDGYLTAIEGVARDITDRVLAEEVLRESEEKFKAIFRESLDVIFIADIETGFIININEAVKRTLGYAPEDLIDKHFSVLFGAQTALMEKLKQAHIAHGVLDSNIFLRADGSVCPMDVTATMIPWGKSRAILVTLRDVSEREQAAEALRHNDAKLRALLNGIPDIMFLVNGDGIILECKFPHSSTAVGDRLVGLDLTAVSLLSPIPVEVFEEVKIVVRQALETREPQSHESRFESTDKGVRFFDVRASASGENEVVLIVRDVTDSRHAHEKLVRAEMMNAELEHERELVQLKENFISMVSHEFRTPLAVIMSAVDLLEHYFDRLEPERRVEKLRKVKMQADYMNDLLDQVLFISRAKSGKLRFQPKQVDLIAFCLDMIEHTKLRKDYKDHVITFQQAGDLSAVWLDEKLLQHILTNLLENAIKYSPAKSEVIFEVTALGSNVVMKVSDHGIGIPSEDQAHLFEAFHRAGNTDDISGTGLGLSIVKNSVEIHHGTISYESQPNEGTTFIVTLPCRVDYGARLSSTL